MPRYIDPSKIKLTGLTFEDINNEVYFSLSDIRKAIEQTPTADVVEVVRCIDCGHKGAAFCMAGDFPLTKENENDFCSYGERKEQK